jgi:type VI secretion system protein ImpB
MDRGRSVPPKERVNIVYKPATGDAKEEVELPLRILVMGDYTLKEDGRPVQEREMISIDKDNFNKTMKDLNLELDLTVANKLSEDPDEGMSVSLKFESLKDFGPEEVVKHTPELKKLLELREALKSLKGPMSNRPEFKNIIQKLIQDDDARDQILKELKIEE